jgi:hypothetical protein
MEEAAEFQEKIDHIITIQTEAQRISGGARCRNFRSRQHEVHIKICIIPVVVMSSGLRGTSISSVGVNLRTFFSLAGELGSFRLPAALPAVPSDFAENVESGSDSLDLALEAFPFTFACCGCVNN